MDYVELHCHSYYSLLDGASSPSALVEQAAALEMEALALTDHDAVYGALQFASAAEARGIKPIFGAELTLEGDHHLTVLVENAAGWRNLCALISKGRANAPKGQSCLRLVDLRDHTTGLIALSGCWRGEIATALLWQDKQEALAAASRYRELFEPACFWIELQNHLRPDDDKLVSDLAQVAQQVGIGIVATNNVHYAKRESHRLQDVLVCIKHNIALDASEGVRRPNSEFYLKDAARMAPLFTRFPQALRNTCLIADRCAYKPEYGLQDLPVFPTPCGLSAQAYLRELCLAALTQRYGDGASEVETRLDYELGVIERSGLSNYFLIVWDIVRYARDHQIRCQGRGSAANSLVAYLLRISPIDPLKHNLVFERFLSDERRLPPDIDLDSDAIRREEIIQYMYRRYGTDHAAMACTYITFQARSSLRDVGKALGLPPALIDQAAKKLDSRDTSKIAETVGVEVSEPWAQLLDICQQIDGYPRHLGLHNGGMVVTGGPLADRLPTEPATMSDRVALQWDKEGLELAGLVKVDLLGLRMLSALDKAANFVAQLTGAYPDLDGLTFDDANVYEMISSARTVGVFQVESRAQAQMLPRMRPKSIHDLIVAISLIRPGPILGQMVHPYLRRRSGVEPVTYPHPSLQPVLEETLGVLLFQEQCILVASVLAGFTPGQSELLRRALGSKRAAAALHDLRAAFMAGTRSKGIPDAVAEDVFAKLSAFGSYSFSKAHAAAFAVLVYQSAWLKRYYPAALFAALLNVQPAGFWSPAVLLDDAKLCGVTILPVDINRSSGDCTIENGAIRLGLKYVSGFGEASIERLEQARLSKPFASIDDLCRRTHLPRRIIRNLILSGSMDEFGERRHLLWRLAEIEYQETELDLVFLEEDMGLFPMSAEEAFAHEYSVLGLSTTQHPMNFYREWMGAHQVLDSAGLAKSEHGAKVRVAGLVVVHQAPPTAHGMHFITLSDPDGFANLVIRPQIYQQYRSILREAPILIVEGHVQRNNDVVNLVVDKAARMPMITPSQQAHP